jgi:hypothetical protein
LFSILNRRRSYKNSYWEIMSLFFFEIQWIRARFTTRPVLERTVRVAEETSNQTIECPVLAQFIDKSCIFNHKVYKSMFISLTHCNTLLEYLKNKKWDLFYQYIEALTLFIENKIICKIWNLQFLSLECRSNCAVLQVLQIISIKSVSYQLMLPKAYFQIFRFRLSEKKLKTFKIKELKKLKKIKRKLSAGVFVINKH